jgi:predicted dehydrogenase
MREELRVAVAGFGKMGLLHTSILRMVPGVRLCAVAEPNPLVRRFTPRLLGGPRFYAELSRLLERERPDAVFVTAPTAHHAELCATVLRAGCSLFVEKPLGSDALECEPLLRLAADSGCTTMVGYSKRFVPTFALARERLLSGAIGKPLGFHGEALVSQVFSAARGWRFRQSGGGGVLSVLGCHLVDIVRWLLGEIESAGGEARSLYSAEVEDELVAELRLTSGLRGTIECSWSRPEFRIPELRLAIQCEAGSLEVSEDRLRQSDGGRTTTVYKQQLDQAVDFDVGGPEYSLEDAHFVEAVRRGSATAIPLDEGYQTQLALDRIYRSVRVVRRVAS